MTGANLIDAVASRLGLNVPTANTLPSRAIILEWINTATVELVRDLGQYMPNLFKTFIYTLGTPTTPFFTEVFANTQTLTDTWEAPTAGTWAIAGNQLEATHDNAIVADQTMQCKTLHPVPGTKYFIQVTVKAHDVSESKLGVWFGGQFYLWEATKYTQSVDGDTGTNPGFVDDVAKVWLFEVGADGSVKWYVDGALINSGTATIKDSSLTLLLVARKRVSDTVNKYYFDTISMWAAYTDLSDCAKMVAVRMATTGLNAVEVPLNEFFTNQVNQKTDKPIWSWAAEGAGLRTVQVSPSGSYTCYYAQYPSLWIDGAAPLLRLTTEWEPEIIKHATAWGKMSEQDPESYVAIMGKGGA